MSLPLLKVNPVLKEQASDLPTFRIHPVKAREAVNNARRLFSAGELDQSEKLTVETLLACPNCFVGYQLLGELLDHQGMQDSAQQAYLGELPDSLVHKYLSACSLSGLSGAPTERQVVHGPESFELSPPARLEDTQKWKFGNKQVVANETWVDTVKDGSIWDDGHNTAVFDIAGGIVDEHSMGSMPVVNELRQHCSPLYLGPRVFLLGARGGGNFYHWMTDILPKLAILRDAGYEFTDSDRFVVSTFNKAFQKETLKACGLSAEQIVASCDSSPYFCGDLLVVPRLKNVMGLHMGGWLPQFLQDSLLPSKQPGSDTGAEQKRIFVSRDPAASNGRSIGNIVELNKIFQQCGFEIVYPERLTLTEQASCFHNASVIFAPHGAGLTNIVFCKPGTRVVEFYGAHIAPCYWAISAIAGLKYFNEFCLPEGIPADGDASTLAARRSAGFTVNVDRVYKLLAMVGVDR